MAKVLRNSKAARLASTFAEGDFSPRKLLCNHKWLQEKAQEYRNAGFPALALAIPLVRITLPSGGIEHRPVERFDVLPRNWAENVWVADLSRSKPTYRPVDLGDNFDRELTDPIDVGIAVLLALRTGATGATRETDTPPTPTVKLLGWKGPEPVQAAPLATLEGTDLGRPLAVAEFVREALAMATAAPTDATVATDAPETAVDVAVDSAVESVTVKAPKGRAPRKSRSKKAQGG